MRLALRKMIVLASIVTALGFLALAGPNPAQGGDEKPKIRIERAIIVESEAGHQARTHAAERTHSQNIQMKEELLALLEKQPDETNESYIERLHLTIKGFINPWITQREGEADHFFLARCREHWRKNLVFIARPGEDESIYRKRIAAWRESEASRQARLRKRIDNRRSKNQNAPEKPRN
ncbi:hypothetical protein ACFL6U_28890 [Planctomycetota bacterium]